MSVDATPVATFVPERLHMNSMPVILQNILDHVRDSRFAVRARNADDLLRFRHAPDKIRAQNNSPRTRHGRALSPDEL